MNVINDAKTRHSIRDCSLLDALLLEIALTFFGWLIPTISSWAQMLDARDGN